MTSPNQKNLASSNLNKLDAAELMVLWDKVQATPADARTARAARPWYVTDEDMSVGELQAAALRGYAAQFGDKIACSDRCSECETALGVELSATALLAAHLGARTAGGLFETGTWIIRYRLLCIHDIAKATAAPDLSSARDILVKATVLDATRHGEPQDIETIPSKILEDLSAQLEEEDPLAAAEMALICPECGAKWHSGFDACDALLKRLEVFARRTLWQVHELAMRYGWSEAELLSMSPARRDAYMMMDTP